MDRSRLGADKAGRRRLFVSKLEMGSRSDQTGVLSKRIHFGQPSASGCQGLPGLCGEEGIRIIEPCVARIWLEFDQSFERVSCRYVVGCTIKSDADVEELPCLQTGLREESIIDRRCLLVHSQPVERRGKVSADLEVRRVALQAATK